MPIFGREGTTGYLFQAVADDAQNDTVKHCGTKTLNLKSRYHYPCHHNYKSIYYEQEKTIGYYGYW